MQASDHDIEIVAFNDLGDVATMAHLLKYDSILGPLSEEVSVSDGGIVVGGKTVKAGRARYQNSLGRPRWTSSSITVSSPR